MTASKAKPPETQFIQLPAALLRHPRLSIRARVVMAYAAHGPDLSASSLAELLAVDLATAMQARSRCAKGRVLYKRATGDGNRHEWFVQWPSEGPPDGVTWTARDILGVGSSYVQSIRTGWDGKDDTADAEADAHGQAAYRIWYAETTDTETELAPGILDAFVAAAEHERGRSRRGQYPTTWADEEGARWDGLLSDPSADWLPEAMGGAAYWAARALWAEKNRDRVCDDTDDFLARNSLGYYLRCLWFYRWVAPGTAITAYVIALGNRGAGVENIDQWQHEEWPFRDKLEAAEAAIWEFADTMLAAVRERWDEVEAGAAEYLREHPAPESALVQPEPERHAVGEDADDCDDLVDDLLA